MAENHGPSDSEPTRIHREIVLANETARYLLNAMETLRREDNFTLRWYPKKDKAQHHLSSFDMEYDGAVVGVEKAIRERQECL